MCYQPSSKPLNTKFISKCDRELVACNLRMYAVIGKLCSNKNQSSTLGNNAGQCAFGFRYLLRSLTYCHPIYHKYVIGRHFILFVSRKYVAPITDTRLDSSPSIQYDTFLCVRYVSVNAI